MGMKVVEEAEKDEFMAKCKEAESDLVNREAKLDKVYSDFERNIVLIGATAVEDRLQDDVPQTINSLQQAGIKIWMLTGDKLETAENIGESCKLIKRTGMQIHRLSDYNSVEKFCTDEMVRKNAERIKKEEMMGILVEAKALAIILEDYLFKEKFL